MARKEKDIHYIYKTTCNVTGRWYVGMHSTSNENDGYMGSGLRLRRSIRKYGVDNHTKEILEYCDSREKLVLREIEIVTSEFIQDEMCMNLKEGGCGGFYSLEASKKGGQNGINKMLKMMWVDNPEKYSEIVSNRLKKQWKDIEFLNKMSNRPNWEGKTHSEETKQLMSEQRKGTGVGETNSQFGTCWVTKDGVNKKVKKEHLDSFIKAGWIKGRKK